jgi:hypothetical protein
VTYSLPPYSDSNGDTVLLSVSLGAALTFITYSNGEFVMNPKTTD